AIIPKQGVFILSPKRDTVYPFSTKGVTSAASFAKTGPATVTLRGGSHTVSLAGDWSAHARAVSGGGALVLDGASFTNTTRAGRWNIFGDAGNTISVRGGASLINKYGGNTALIEHPRNTIEVAGAGSLLDLCGDSFTFAGNDSVMTVRDGATVRRTGAQTGWNNTSGGTIDISGAGTVWDAAGRGFMVGHGAMSCSNLLRVADGAVAKDTYVWVGGGSHWDYGGGFDNRLEILDGGKVFAGANDLRWNGSAIGLSGADKGRVDRNTALVSGKGSEWDLGERDLYVGFVFIGGAVGVSNSVTATKGGVVHKAETLRIGEARDGGKTSGNFVAALDNGRVSARHIVIGTAATISNALVWDSTSLVTSETLHVHPGNCLSPIIGADGAAPLEPTSGAKFAYAALINPIAAPGLKPGKYVILKTHTIDDNGLMLDPALIKSGEWQVVVDEKEVAVIYAPK
ncbi:MAG: hypothetical protein FWG05_03595, partial [Kiritimatiellaeota bacterium]|nr:hypothetical protein [Kiritimatiellota bacterium]